MADPELDALKREFLAEAHEKVEEMQSKLSGERNAQTLERLIYLAHQLKGSGGSYGFQRISTESADLEKAVEKLAHGDSPAGLEADIRQYVINLRVEIDQRSRELSATARVS